MKFKKSDTSDTSASFYKTTDILDLTDVKIMSVIETLTLNQQSLDKNF